MQLEYKKKYRNLFKDYLKGQGITSICLAKELSMSFCIIHAYVCDHRWVNLVSIFKEVDIA